MNKKIILFTLSSLFFSSILISSNFIAAIGLSSSATTVCVSPPTVIEKVGQTFTININVSSVIDLYAWQFNLTWNPALLHCVSVTQGSFFLNSSGKTLFGNDSGTGYNFVHCTLYETLSGVTGNGILATVKFYVESEGECGLDLNDTELANSSEQLIANVNVINGRFSGIAINGPTAKFTYSAPYPYRTVTFNASTSLPGWNGTSDMPIKNYKWVFGDGAKNTTANPIITHKYMENGTYTVTLNVTDSQGTDSQGVWNTTSKTITLAPEIAIIGISPYAYGVYPTYDTPLQINVTAQNEGVTIEGFNVSLYWNATNLIGKQSIVNLAPGENKTLTFNWSFPPLPGYPNNPSEAYPYPTYIMSANASKVLNETDMKNNTLTDGTVTVKWPGDANGDGKVDSLDLSVMAHSWYAKRGAPNYNAQADFNGDGVVNSLDLSIMAHSWYRGPLH